MVFSFIVAFIKFPNNQKDASNAFKQTAQGFFELFFSSDFQYIILYGVLCLIFMIIIICSIAFIIQNSVAAIVVIFIIDLVFPLFFTMFQSVKIVKTFLNFLPTSLMETAQHTSNVTDFSTNINVLILFIEAVIFFILGFICFKYRKLK